MSSERPLSIPPPHRAGRVDRGDPPCACSRWGDTCHRTAPWGMARRQHGRAARHRQRTHRLPPTNTLEIIMDTEDRNMRMLRDHRGQRDPLRPRGQCQSLQEVRPSRVDGGAR